MINNDDFKGINVPYGLGDMDSEMKETMDLFGERTDVVCADCDAPGLQDEETGTRDERSDMERLDRETYVENDDKVREDRSIHDVGENPGLDSEVMNP